MTELRYDATTRDWVVFATERARRPHEFLNSRENQPIAFRTAHLKKCPFCPGNEALAPQEVYVGRADGADGWAVRVVPNRFPALRIEDQTDRRIMDDLMFVTMGGVGAHEVVIETPLHDSTLALLPTEQIAEVLWAYRARTRDLMRDRRFKLIQIFKNHGVSAGTSLEHPHSQIVATPVVPHVLRIKYEVAIDHYDQTGRCLYCELLHAELNSGRRLVRHTDHFVVLHPFASRVPFETWIMPSRHQPSFSSISDELVPELASVLQDTLLELYQGLGDPAYNMILHTAPVGEEDRDYFLWHVQIVPRLTTMAGFELGTGMSINTALPEETAEFIRSLEVRT